MKTLIVFGHWVKRLQNPSFSCRRVAAASAGALMLLLILTTGAYAQTDQELYDQAQRLFDTKHYAEAAAIWKDLRASPSDDLARGAAYKYARCLYREARDYKAAEAAFLAVRERWPDASENSSALLMAGYSALHTNYAIAKTHWEEVVSAYPTSNAATDAKLRLGYMAHINKDLATAERWFWEAANDPRQEQGRRVDAYVQYGFTAIMRYFQDEPDTSKDAAANLLEARVRLQQAADWLKTQPGYEANAAFCQVGVAESYIWSKDPSNAEGNYRRALGEYGELPAALELLVQHGMSVSLIRQGKNAEALTHLQRAQEIISTGPEATFPIEYNFTRFDCQLMTVATLFRLDRAQEAQPLAQALSTEAEQQVFKQGAMSWLGAEAMLWDARILARLGQRVEAKARCLKTAEVYAHVPEKVALAQELAKKLGPEGDM